jgi:hypothetical protein
MNRPRPTAPRPPDPADLGRPSGSWETGAARDLQVDVAPLARRRRLPDRAIVMAAIAGLFVVLAIVKPWELGRPEGPSALADPTPIPSTPSIAPTPAIPEPLPIELPGWAALAAATEPRDAWGVRVLTDVPAGGRSAPLGSGSVPLPDGKALAEQWFPARAPFSGPPGRLERRAGLARLLIVPPGEAPIRLLALTSPADAAPLDIRLWRLSLGGLERLDAARPAGDTGLGDWYLLPPTVDGRVLPAWPAGWYRIDVLTADGVSRVGLRVDEGPATLDRWTLLADGPVVASATVADGPEPADRGLAGQPDRPEAFMVIGDVVASLPVRFAEALDEWRSWLGAFPGEGPIDLPRTAAIHIPDAAGFGLRFPDGATEIRLTATPLVGPGRPHAASRVGLHAGPEGGSPWAVVDAPAGRSWTPGIHRLDAIWRDGTGEVRRASYHVDLLAGRSTPTPTMLAATRAWARHVGRSGVVAGLVEPLQVPPSKTAIQVAVQTPAATPLEAVGRDAACRIGDGLAGTRRPVGILTGASTGIDAVDVLEIQAYARPRLVASRAVIEPLPGLVVLGPDDPAGWAAGRYAVQLRTATELLTYGFCVE